MDAQDTVLVEECLNGKKASYEKLVKKYKDSVYNLAYRMTNSCADAEDITQDTFLRAYRKLGTYKKNYSFRNWILTICSNTTKNIFRKRVHRREIEESYWELEYLEDHHAGTHGLDDRFKAALGQLSDLTRAALVLKHCEGCSHEEIAEILNIGVSAAKMRVKRGRDELLAALKNQEERNER